MGGGWNFLVFILGRVAAGLLALHSSSSWWLGTDLASQLMAVEMERLLPCCLARSAVMSDERKRHAREEREAQGSRPGSAPGQYTSCTSSGNDSKGSRARWPAPRPSRRKAQRVHGGHVHVQRMVPIVGGGTLPALRKCTLFAQLGCTVLWCQLYTQCNTGLY